MTSNPVFAYSLLLLVGMVVSQTVDLLPWASGLHRLTQACLAYIMVEVGLEFELKQDRLKGYALDGGVAAAAAVFPWVFCALYFMAVLQTSWKEAWLVALFAAPTSAGVLFTLLAAGGLSATWVYKKARVLAIFDDIVTILLLIPLQIIFGDKGWTLGGSALVPSFLAGCFLRKFFHIKRLSSPPLLDRGIKMLFIFLVGCSVPRVILGENSLGVVAAHVVGLTLLSNMGKCFPFLFFKGEATARERWALSVAMFPRGEVGAGVLLVALGYGLTGLPVALAGLSLALNLLLTGVFIAIVRRLLTAP